jgi:hypothetical protein
LENENLSTKNRQHLVQIFPPNWFGRTQKGFHEPDSQTCFNMKVWQAVLVEASFDVAGRVSRKLHYKDMHPGA